MLTHIICCDKFKRMKLTKTQESKINKVRDEVESLQKKQDEIFDALIDELNIKKDSRDGDILWDYVYNDFGEISKVRITTIG